MDDSYINFSYHPGTFRTVVRILVSSIFLSTVSKVAIKVVGLRREHRPRLLKRTNAKDDHGDDDDADADDAGDDEDDDDADDDADAIPTFTTIYAVSQKNCASVIFE